MSYTHKVEGSNPPLPTMKQIISDYYRQKGFEVVYIATNKEPRRVATLKRFNQKATGSSPVGPTIMCFSMLP